MCSVRLDNIFWRQLMSNLHKRVAKQTANKAFFSVSQRAAQEHLFVKTGEHETISNAYRAVLLACSVIFSGI